MQPIQPARWSRRRLLFDMGIGTAGIAILTACGSDSSGQSSGDTAADGSPAPTGTDAPEPSPTSDDAPAADEPTPPAADGGALQLQHVDLGFVSAYVLVRGSEAAIVDTGTSGSGPAIFEALAAVGRSPGDVRHVVLTHNHGDHVGGLGELEAELTNATVSAGPGDVDTIRTALSLVEVADGDEVFGMGVIGTPGHTPGSISVFDTDTGLLVAGDAINGDGEGGITGANPNFTPDMSTADRSVARLAALMPDVAAFGHGGPPVTDDVTAKLSALAG